MEIRRFQASDWEDVAAIYESGIATGMATFETSAPSFDSWDQGHLGFGRWVADSGSSLLGWVALSPVSDRCVYGGVAEVSVYVHPDAKGKGIGALLLQRAIEDSEANGIWTLNAAMFSENVPSINLHGKLGFRKIGYREKIAQWQGEWKDNVIMERRSKKVGV